MFKRERPFSGQQSEKELIFSTEESLQLLQLDVANIYESLKSLGKSSDLELQTKLLTSLKARLGATVGKPIPNRQFSGVLERVQQITTRLQQETEVQQVKVDLRELATTCQQAVVFLAQEHRKKMSRRTFLGVLGIGTVATLVGMNIGTIDRFFFMPSLDEEDIPNQNSPEYDYYAELLRRLSEVYGLTIVTGVSVRDMLFDSGQSISPEKLVLELNKLVNVVAKYPPNFFRRNRITTISLVKNLTHSSVKVGNSAGSFSRNSGTMYLDIDDDFSVTFDHEAYHGCDWNENGYDPENQRWQELHNCACLGYGVEPSQRSAANYDDAFTSDYAATSPGEDRATIAEQLLSPLLYAELRGRLRTLSEEPKRILEEKIELIKQDYYRFSDGLMDEQFWIDLWSLRVGPTYFDSKDN